MKTIMKTARPQKNQLLDFQNYLLSSEMQTTIKGGDDSIIVEEIIVG